MHALPRFGDGGTDLFVAGQCRGLSGRADRVPGRRKLARADRFPARTVQPAQAAAPGRWRQRSHADQGLLSRSRRVRRHGRCAHERTAAGEPGLHRDVSAHGRHRDQARPAADAAQPVARPCAVTPRRAAAFPDLGQLPRLPWRAGRGALRQHHVHPDRSQLRRRLQHFRIWRVALVADGAGRARSGVLRPARERIRAARGGGSGRAVGQSRDHLPVLPRRDGAAAARDRRPCQSRRRTESQQFRGCLHAASHSSRLRAGRKAKARRDVPIQPVRQSRARGDFLRRVPPYRAAAAA